MSGKWTIIQIQLGKYSNAMLFSVTFFLEELQPTKHGESTSNYRFSTKSRTLNPQLGVIWMNIKEKIHGALYNIT